MSQFRVVDSTPVVNAGFLAVTEEHVAGPADESFTRYVVRHPGAVVMVPVEDDGETVLMLRQFRAATGGDLLEIPAGKRDVDGEPPEETAVRELEEEIARKPGRLVKLCEFFNSPGFCDEYTHLFLALDLAELATPVAVNAEEREMTIERVALRDVDQLIATREIIDAKSIVGLQLARRYLAGEYEGLR
ncbi:MAG TPA: NUDIX hydrolase [Acidimicrobiia bacterium]|nr:NUDIX hydrolase [Acidimicrobiia bacterium]